MPFFIQNLLTLSGKFPPRCSAASLARRPGLLPRIFSSLCPALALCITLALCPTAVAQVRTPMPPPFGPAAGPKKDDDPALRHITEQMAKERNSLRQKKIVADTALLLNLAKKLNDEVSHSDKNELSISVVQEAEKIEKLAKSIKEKMRDGE